VLGVCGAEGLVIDDAGVCVWTVRLSGLHTGTAHTILCAGLGGLESGGFRLQHRICWLEFTFSWIIIGYVHRCVVGDSSSSLKFKIRGAICINHNRNSLVL
jgi:hypothetical protein